MMVGTVSLSLQLLSLFVFDVEGTSSKGNQSETVASKRTVIDETDVSTMERCLLISEHDSSDCTLRAFEANCIAEQPIQASPRSGAEIVIRLF